ncbi:AMY1.6 [Symbiodinium natans]|uniref:AMY1.6 protein n=1 Tax=Symbiodinium natans TaxID=878477 RepID=A0A812JGH3_9DINO|nr:AMY1.6 [Symbiodinium natans]
MQQGQLSVCVTSHWAQTMSFKLLAVFAAFNTLQAAKLVPIPSQQDSIVNMLANVPKSSESKAKASEMEQMVMLLAQQAKLARKQSQGADGNVTELVKQIKEELGKMQGEVLNAAGVAEAGCKQALANISVGCPLYSGNTTFLPEGFTGDFAPLRSTHAACRAEIVAKKQELDACKTSRESLISLEQTLTTEFQGINIFESPEECAVKGEDVLLYLGSMRDHFKNKQLTWWKTYYHLENVTQNITQWNCTDKEIEYFEKVAECQAAQLELEETACQVHERTNQSCASLPACYSAKWTNYEMEVAASNKTVQDLKFEYKAIQRIMCLLDAFSATDMDAAIDACIAARHSAAAVRSSCVDSHAGIEKPSFTTPEVCSGVQSILHPSDPNFNETEYTANGIQANKCLASCCTIDWYSWSIYNNAFVTQEHYMIDADTGHVAAFGTMDEAKAACEMMGSVLCFGIYDTKCDGATEESPVKLIKAPGLDLESVKESNIGSCVLRMKLGSETTVTTTIAQICSYEVNVSRTDVDPSAVWKTYHVDKQEYGEVFRFSGCADAELDEAAECVASGVANGVRVLKNRHGQAVGTGVCCASATNTVLSTKPTQCDGYADNYTKIENKYLTSTKLIRGTTYSNMASAREACLRMGHKCWGIFDDKCDTVNLMLVDGYLDDTESHFRDSSQSSCIFKKEAA